MSCGPLLIQSDEAFNSLWDGDMLAGKHLIRRVGRLKTLITLVRTIKVYSTPSQKERRKGKIFRFLNYLDLPANIGARLRVYNLFQVIDCKILKILTAYSSLLKRRIVTHYEETKVRVIVFVVLLTTDPNKHL